MMQPSTDVWGVNPEAVIAAIHERTRRGQSAGGATDGKKLGLIIEGGGMRGVISASALLALEALGMTEVFDAVYGTSAGAMNGAYFLAGQAGYGITIYYQDISNRRFINPLRLGKVVDIDYLFDKVITQLKPLNVARVLASPADFYITITEVYTAKCVLANAKQSHEALLTILKASTALPVMYNRVVVVEGRPYMDGGVTNHIPLQEAIADGCTDLMVLLTRPASFVEPSPTWVERWLFKRVCARENAVLLEVFLKTYRHSNAVRNLALGRHPPDTPVNILTICPGESDPRVERTTKSRKRLKAAAMTHALRTLQTFGSECTRLVEVLRPFPL
jgi:predicted patatin/cPLA2 family phospholipase